MGDFLTTDKLREILKPVPKESRSSAVEELIARGHEIEGLNAEFSPLESVANIPSSLMEFGKNIWIAASSPLETINSLSSIALGGMRVATEKALGKQLGESPRGGSQNDEENFKNMVNFFSERYGSVDRLLNTIEKDPVGFLADAATFIGGVGGILKGAGVASKLSTIEKIGGSLVKVSRALEPTTVFTKAVSKLTKPVRVGIRRLNEATGVNKTLRAASGRIMADVFNATPGKRINIAGKTKIKEDPMSFMTKHGISGSLEQMELQLNGIKQASRAKVDEVINRVQGRFKFRDAKVLLNEVRNSLTKEFEDIIPIDDVVTLKKKVVVEDVGESKLPARQSSTQTPQRISDVSAEEFVEFKIPSEHRRTIRIPKENLSTDFIESLGEIKDLLKKFDKNGLTLSEIQKVKRISDDFLDIYKESGDAKAVVRFKNLDKARKRVRSFIENEANNQGFDKIFELNQQTSLAKNLEDLISKRIIAGKTKSPWIDRISGIVIGGGITGSVLGESFTPLALAGAGLGGLELLRLPRVKSYFATRLRLMADGEFQELLEVANTGKQTSRARKIIQRERDRFRKILPELRVAGLTQNQEGNKQ